MASLVYNWTMNHVANGDVNFSADSFKLMLVSAAYAPNKDAHNFRNDVTNEVSGAGYTAGGNAVAASVAKDDANDRIDVSFGSVSWPAATITARGGVVYKARGGSPGADELIAYADFGGDVSSNNGTFTVNFSSPLRFQN